MTAKDLLLFQIGRAGAIRSVAGARYLLHVGIALVLITSVPRNYDQTYIGEVPWWPVLPLLFSFFSGSFLFWVVNRGFIHEAEASSSRNYWMFMGLFWMTAPVAWLYGIPVERFLDARAATVANLWLLGIVAAWRVILLSRVLTVVYNVPWLRAGGWVLLGACLEVVFILFFSGFGEALGRGMAGMRNSPEQDLIIQVLAKVFWASLIVVPVLLIFLKAVLELTRTAQMEDLPASKKMPWLFLLICAAAWSAIAISPQKELAKEWKYRSLLKKYEMRDALAFLNTMEARDWPPAKSFRPDPFEFEVWTLLPPLMEQVTGNEKPWVQEKLLWVFDQTFGHRFPRFKEEGYLKILNAIEKFEGGEEWIRNSAEFWNKRPRFILPWTNLVSHLEAKGVTVKIEAAPK